MDIHQKETPVILQTIYHITSSVDIRIDTPKSMESVEVQPRQVEQVGVQPRQTQSNASMRRPTLY